jgi:hypothetical protein
MKKWVFLSIIATLVSLFAISSSAYAFGRRGGRCFTSCSTPCYPIKKEIVFVPEIVPVLAYPVLVPAFQFQYVPQAYAPVAQVVPVTGYPVATPIIQPVAPYGQPPMGYGQSNGQPYGQPNGQPYGQPNGNGYGLNNKDKIRELAKALLEEMSKMSENGPVDSGPPVVPGTQPVSQVPFQQPQQPNLAQFSVAAMGRTCAQCHTGVGSKGDMIIFNQPGLLNQQANWKKIKDEVLSGRMPPKDVHFQLSTQERQSIVQWLTSVGIN